MKKPKRLEQPSDPHYSIMTIAEIRYMIELLERFEKLSFVTIHNGTQLVRSVREMAENVIPDAKALRGIL